MTPKNGNSSFVFRRKESRGLLRLRFTTMRKVAALILLACAWPAAAAAQAPSTPPLVLHLPSSARTMALGNAWVAGRDAEVLFYNPAQLIGSRSDIAVSVQ